VATRRLILTDTNIGLDEADRMKQVLERHRFKMTFASFSELLQRENRGG